MMNGHPKQPRTQTLRVYPPIVFQTSDSPQAALDAWLGTRPEPGLLIVEFGHRDPGQAPCRLWLMVCAQRGGELRFGIRTADPESGRALAGAASRQGEAAPEHSPELSPEKRFAQWLEQGRAPSLPLGEPLRLQPVHIAKPWGQEIWYTGIELRGISLVGDGQRWLPLSWLLAALPRIYGAEPPVLLKILDPLPDEPFGDLYFELHQEKREVYVVTGVDREAWPDGVGAIRYGFDPDLLATYSNADAFRSDYLAAVEAYRRVRVEIDALLDQRRAGEGIAADAPLPASQLRHWLDALPAALLEREQTLRRAMERYTRLRPLRVGDVVRVPLLTPHALQHGVRTVEFQTPVYERLILSFGQKVLTQSGWDTGRAAEVMRLEPVEDEPLPLIREDVAWREQRIVDFPDFEACRLEFSRAGACRLPRLARGGVAMSVAGSVRIGSLDLQPEQAALLPLDSSAPITANTAACLLWAQPRRASDQVE